MSISYRPSIGGLDAISLVTIDPTPNGLSITGDQVLSLGLSSTSTTGALSSTDWSTFNAKQAPGNYITALTGDGTASGPGSVAFTLATVNGNVGSFGTATQVSTFTVNAKGLITAASNTAIQITESQVTNLTTDLSGKASTDLSNLTSTAINQNLIFNKTSPLVSSPDASTTTQGMVFRSGSSTGANASASGTVLVQSGDKTAGSGNSGTATFQSGLVQSGTSGAVIVASGIANVTSGASGVVTIQSGNTPGAGNSGAVNLTSGNSVSAASGDIVLQTGTAGTTRGVISLNGLSINANSTKINNVTDPTSLQDAATKSYVDVGLATKQATGNYITALTGDITASGPGSVASTLATVNSNVGSFTNANITVNAKGLVTAAANGTATSGTVTSVAATVPSVLSISGSPITTSGTLAISYSGTALPVANGGTNSIASLNNNRNIVSSGGAIVESAAITANRALISDANGLPTQSAVTSTTLAFLDATSSVQTQINTKAPTASPTFTGVATSPVFTFTPQSADPGTPTTGETQYADGTARTAGLWTYTGSAWAPVGANAGFIGTDWTSYSPTLTGFGTVTGSSWFYKRVGSNILVSGYWANGTVAASLASVSLPSGLSIDTTAFPRGNTTASSGQLAGTWGSNRSSNQGYMITATGTSATVIYFTDKFATATIIATNGSQMSQTGDTMAAQFSVPIATWATNTVAAVQSINARAFASATTISSSLATIVWTTEDYDTDNALSAGVFTVPSSGKYAVNTALLITGTIALNNTLVLEIQKNGTVVSRFTEFFPATLTDGKGMLSDIIQCTAGDTIRIQASTTATAPSIVSSNFDNFFSIAKIGN